MRSAPKWFEKWRELEKMVCKKYESHISIVGLVLHQFGEHKGAHVLLSIRRYYFALGTGASRLSAINMALRTVKTNSELNLAFLDLWPLAKSPNCFQRQCIARREAPEEIRIIEECQKEFRG